MSRIIEIRPGSEPVPAQLTVAPGDVLRFTASGGHVRTGSAVHLVGIFVPALVGTDGRVLAPMGAPNTVLFHALTPGRAEIDVVTGDPWHEPATVDLTVVVEPAPARAEGAAGLPRPW